jgi:3',5'-cyclic AMP phosphodiesterase CpdA
MKVTDFEVEMQKGRAFTLLQITDMQIIDAAQRRYPERLSEGAQRIWATDRTEECFYGELRALVQKVRPDLIFVTGDIVYGSFDDSGARLDEFVRKMGELGIPWAPVFGNHDNETAIGVAETCRRYETAPNCLFRRGSVTGNSNYTVGLVEDGALCRILYMMDSNGCGGAYEGETSVKRSIGFGEDQVEWVRATAEAIRRETGKTVPAFAAFHIPTEDFCDALVAGGYQAEEKIGEPGNFEIGVDVPAASEGDMGYKNERLPRGGCHPAMRGVWKAAGVDGVFVGHFHKNATSILFDGIRYTFGVKTGSYDYHQRTGGTVITLQDGDRKSFTVRHEYMT